MGIESKIRELLEGAANRPLDKQQGDSSMPSQGDSNANPTIEDLSGSSNKDGGLTAEVGKEVSKKAKKDTTLPAGSGAGDAVNFETKGGKASGLVGEEVEVEVETEFKLFQEDLSALFADEDGLTEEFKVKAANIFEAMVTARINSEIELIEQEISEQAVAEVEAYTQELVEKVDKYLSYVTETWMGENLLAIETGLKNEITESFIAGLKNVFSEHYIEVPEEKYDVLGQMQSEIVDLKAKLDEGTQIVVTLREESINLKKEKVFVRVCEDLASTETEKFKILVEDISFTSEESYEQKLRVVKDNYFQKDSPAETEKLEDTMDTNILVDNSVMSKYSNAISKNFKF